MYIFVQNYFQKNVHFYIDINTLEFHHLNPNIKEFKLGSGNTISWKEYKQEALKCILVCSNCHKEIHSKIGYKKEE